MFLSKKVNKNKIKQFTCLYLFSILGDKKKEIKKSTTKRESQRLNKPYQLMPQDFDNEVMMQHVQENDLFFTIR